MTNRQKLKLALWFGWLVATLKLLVLWLEGISPFFTG